MPFKNKEDRIKNSKLYYDKNRNLILKKKSIIREDPNYQKKMKDYLKVYYLEHKEENRPKKKDYKSKLLLRNKLYIQEYLKTHPCVDCGNDNPIVAEFDHVRGKKTKEISFLVSQPASLKTIQEEIDKCDVRCANCHRIVTVKRRQEAKLRSENTSLD